MTTSKDNVKIQGSKIINRDPKDKPKISTKIKKQFVDKNNIEKLYKKHQVTWGNSPNKT